MTDMDNVDIERAHRVKSKDAGRCTIIGKFGKFKDRKRVFNAATQVLTQESGYYVKPDFTDRVKRHRRVLGERMVIEWDSGRYAANRYDKLYIEDRVFKYDDVTDSIVDIGKRHTARGPRTITETTTTAGNSKEQPDNVATSGDTHRIDNEWRCLRDLETSAASLFIS